MGKPASGLYNRVEEGLSDLHPPAGRRSPTGEILHYAVPAIKQKRSFPTYIARKAPFLLFLFVYKINLSKQIFHIHPSIHSERRDVAVPKIPNKLFRHSQFCSILPNLSDDVGRIIVRLRPQSQESVIDV